MGPGIINPSQELVLDLNASTVSGVQIGTYGSKTVHDTPLVSIKSIIRDLDVQKFCDSVPEAAQNNTRFTPAITFWFGFLIVVISQALMAQALHGEKERVSVHETYDAEANDDDGTYGS